MILHRSDVNTTTLFEPGFGHRLSANSPLLLEFEYHVCHLRYVYLDDGMRLVPGPLRMIRAVSSYAVQAFTGRKERKICISYPTVSDCPSPETCGQYMSKGLLQNSIDQSLDSIHRQ